MISTSVGVVGSFFYGRDKVWWVTLPLSCFYYFALTWWGRVTCILGSFTFCARVEVYPVGGETIMREEETSRSLWTRLWAGWVKSPHRPESYRCSSETCNHSNNVPRLASHIILPPGQECECDEGPLSLKTGNKDKCLRVSTSVGPPGARRTTA